MHTFFARGLFATLVAGISAVSSLPVHAALVTDSFIGSVASADPTNPFGVSAGDPVAWSTTYDDALVSPSGQSFIAFDSLNSPPFALSVTVGNRTFVESEDNDFDFGFPELSFLDGSLVGIDFIVDFAQGSLSNLTFTAEEFDFEIVDNTAGSLLVEGTLVEDGEPIPAPGALPLLAFGLGVLAFARYGRRS
jgi:hypothetical protein